MAKWEPGWVLLVPFSLSLFLYLFLRISERSKFGRFIDRLWPLGRAPRSFDPEQGELDPEEIEYVHNIRNKSHETEIVISVGLFAGLVAIDVGSVDDWLWSLSLAPKAVGVIATAIKINIWALRIGVLVHLLLRCLWIGIVGLGFSYPRGVNRLRLFGPFQRRMYNHLTAPDANIRLTIQMERLCSLQYATLMCSVFSMFAWIVMLFACVISGRYMAQSIVGPILSRLGFYIQDSVLDIVLITFSAVLLFAFWSYIRVGSHAITRMLRQPIIEILYFFRGTLLSQSILLSIPLAMPPLCLAWGFHSPLVDVDEQLDFVYADEVSNANRIDVPYILSSVVKGPVVQLQLPAKAISIWQAHIANECGSETKTNSSITDKPDELDKFASENLRVWIDQSPMNGVTWIQVASGASLRGFIEVSNLENGLHTLYVDPCNDVYFKSGVSIPFYLSLEGQ